MSGGWRKGVRGRKDIRFFLLEQMKKRRSTREHFRYSLSLVSLWSRSLRSFRRSVQYLFYFSCVYNVILAEDLTRSLSFTDSAGETLQNVPWRTRHPLFSLQFTASPPSPLKLFVDGHKKVEKTNGKIQEGSASVKPCVCVEVRMCVHVCVFPW